MKRTPGIWLAGAALLLVAVLSTVCTHCVRTSRAAGATASALAQTSTSGTTRTTVLTTETTTAPTTAATTVRTTAPKTATDLLQAQQQAISGATAAPDSLAQALDALAAPYGDNVAISYRRLSDNALYLYNPDTEFHIASLVKAPYCMWLLDRASNGEVNLQERLTLRAEDKRPGAGTLQQAPDGTTYSVSEVIAQAIRQSDNTAFAMLRAKYGKAGYIQYTANFALEHPEDVRQVSDGHITARDADRYLLALEWFFRENPNGELLESHMRASATKMIPSTQCAQKWGNYDGCYNVIGVVYADEPYLLAVLTRDFPEFQSAAKLVRQITEAIESNR